jgi:hypothetical protein
MTSIVLIETNGTVKALKAKEISDETLYKKCGFRVSDDFKCRHTWSVSLQNEIFRVSAWAKKTGKANFENKYDFPPPLDKDLFFGTCALVRTDDANQILDLSKEQWDQIYEKLFGGFEDLGDEDEYSEDELEKVDPSLLTAHGYLKDDFVVSDTSPLLSPIPSPPLKSRKTPAKKGTATAKKGKTVAVPAASAAAADDSETDESLSELEEEVYMYSDEE